MNVLQWLGTVAGAALVALVMRDIFHTLWHPGGQGGLSGWLMRLVWSLTKMSPLRRRMRSVSGALAMVTVIGAWAFAMVLGFALIYWPHIDSDFLYSSSIDSADRIDVVDALYVSLTALSTLGLGDIAPQAGWLRLVVPFQALTGFAILTAAVSWVLQISPAIARRRNLSRWLATLRDTSAAQALLDAPAGVGMLLDLARDLTQAHVDLTQFAETYYFRDTDERSTLAVTIDFAQELAATAVASPREDVRAAGLVLQRSLRDVGSALGRFVASTGDPFAAYARDHGPVR